MLLHFTALFVIPIYTVLFAGKSEWFTTNFSVLGTIADRRLAFFIWGVLVGVFFHVAVRRLIPRVGGGTWEWFIKNFALLMLAFAVTTPYLPDETPFKAFLHVIFAAISGVLLLILLLDLMIRYYRMSPRNALPYLVAVGVISVVSMILLVLVGIVSSALEVFMTVSVTLLTWQLLRVVPEVSDER